MGGGGVISAKLLTLLGRVVINEQTIRRTMLIKL